MNKNCEKAKQTKQTNKQTNKQTDKQTKNVECGIAHVTAK